MLVQADRKVWAGRGWKRQLGLVGTKCETWHTEYGQWRRQAPMWGAKIQNPPGCGLTGGITPTWRAFLQMNPHLLLLPFIFSSLNSFLQQDKNWGHGILSLARDYLQITTDRDFNNNMEIIIRNQIEILKSKCNNWNLKFT